MSKIDEVVRELVGVLAGYSPAERAQLLLQAEVILEARDAGDMDIADALLDLFKDGSLEVMRNPDGKVAMRSTEVGLARGAALVREMTGHKPN